MILSDREIRIALERGALKPTGPMAKEATTERPLSAMWKKINAMPDYG